MKMYKATLAKYARQHDIIYVWYEIEQNFKIKNFQISKLQIMTYRWKLFEFVVSFKSKQFATKMCAFYYKRENI